MYNCIQCNKLEDLYFKCNKCKKQFCRRCIRADKHKCQSNMIKSYWNKGGKQRKGRKK